ncbi:TPA: hypothetical protein ACG3ZP_003816 [Escherichia coli]
MQPYNIAIVRFPNAALWPSHHYLSTTDEKWFFRNLGGRKWMKLSGEQGSKLF